MLRVLEKARSKCPIEISSTFCGAHSVPKGSTAAEVLPISSIHQILEIHSGSQIQTVMVTCIQATIDVIEKQLPAVLKLREEGHICLSFFVNTASLIIYTFYR